MIQISTNFRQHVLLLYINIYKCVQISEGGIGIWTWHFQQNHFQTLIIVDSIFYDVFV